MAPCAWPGDAPGLMGVDMSAEHGLPLVLDLGKGHRGTNRFQTVGQFLPHLPRARERGAQVPLLEVGGEGSLGDTGDAHGDGEEGPSSSWQAR